MSDADFPVDTAQIVALFMESVTYGVFLTTFMMCLHGLLYSPTHRFHLKPYFKVNYRMLIAAYLMFIFASLDVAFGLCHNINAFVIMNGNGNGSENAEKVFGDMGNWLNVMKFVNYVVQTFVGDTILIYRCYLVWDRTWYVIIPSVLLCLAETVCGCMVAVIEASPESGGSLNSSTISPFITSMLSITLATTILTTSLIVYRLWNVQSHSQTLLHFQQERKLDFGHSIYSGRNRTSSHRIINRDWNSDPLARAMKVMVESGLLYTLSLVILFAVYITSSNAELGVSDTVVQIIGITFNMIIIRTSRVSSRTQSTAPGPTTIHSEASQPPPPHMISIHTVTDTDCCPDTPLSPLPNRSIRSQYRSSRSSRRSRYSSCPPSEVVPSPSMIGHPGFATLQKQSLLEIPGLLKSSPQSKYERSERSVHYVDSHRSLREDTTVIEGTAESHDNDTVLVGAV